MPFSHVIVWTGNYGAQTFFHGNLGADQVQQFQAKPLEQYPDGNGFFTMLPAFKVLDQFSQIGYTVIGMSGNGACQTSWVLAKQLI